VVLARVNLSRLFLAVGDGRAVFAGEEISLKLLVRNDKRLLPSYSVKCQAPGSGSPAYWVMIPAQHAVEKALRIKFARRGLYSYGEFQLRSGFPFILLNGERSIKASGEVLVYPALCDVEDILHRITGRKGTGVLSLSHVGDDMYSLREFRVGDDWRRIHWKASAKTGALHVKEYAEYENMKVTIILDNLLPEGGELFEKAVSLTASLAREFLAGGWLVRVVSCGKIIPFGSGNDHLFNILTILAVICEDDKLDSPPLDSGDGCFVSVLKSRRSPSHAYAGISSKVIYAEDI
jgi:uncharacterized protein (DUF58 family)